MKGIEDEAVFHLSRTKFQKSYVSGAFDFYYIEHKLYHNFRRGAYRAATLVCVRAPPHLQLQQSNGGLTKVDIAGYL